MILKLNAVHVHLLCCPAGCWICQLPKDVKMFPSLEEKTENNKLCYKQVFTSIFPLKGERRYFSFPALSYA